MSRVTKIFLLYSKLLLYKGKVIEQLRYLYLNKVGKVVFSTVVIRLNNIQAISKLTEFLINFGLNYIKAVDYNICYLVLNKYLIIKYKAENKDSKLITITDKIITAAACYGTYGLVVMVKGRHEGIQRRCSHRNIVVAEGVLKIVPYITKC